MAWSIPTHYFLCLTTLKGNLFSLCGIKLVAHYSSQKTLSVNGGLISQKRLLEINVLFPISLCHSLSHFGSHTSEEGRVSLDS